MKLRAIRDAFTPEFASPESKLVWALRAFLLFLALDALVVTPKFTTRPLLFFSALAGLAASVGFAFIPTRRPRTLKAAESAVVGAVILHVAGHAFGLYAKFGWYDKSLHLVVPLATALTFFALSQATEWIWSWTKVTPIEVSIYLFSMVFAFGGVWELLEFGMDVGFHTEEQNGNLDTMLDLLMDFIGALVGAALAGWATWYGRTHGLDKVAEEPKRPVATRAPDGEPVGRHEEKNQSDLRHDLRGSLP